jgi:hypothetical protein
MKRRHLIASAIVVLGIVVVAVAFTPTRAAASGENTQCSVRTLHGKYAARLWGWQGSGAARVPVTAAGEIVLDGSGSLTGAATFNVDGAIVPQTISGTYTVDGDTCSGEAVTTIGSFHFGIGRQGQETRFSSTTPGTTIVGDIIEE